MESRIGAFWRKPKTDRGPVAKGSLDFSKVEEADKLRIHDAFVKGEKLYVTLWQNKHEEGDKKPDLSMTLDRPYTPGESKPKEEAFVEDIPF